MRGLWILALLTLPAATMGNATAAETSAAAQPRIISLVRHGHYAPDPKADPRLGPGLTALGVAQAQLLGARLAALPQRFDAVRVSPLTRAQQTAAAMLTDFHGAPVHTLAGLEECTPPTWREEIVASESEESLSRCAEQLDAVFAQHFIPASGKAQHELFVCHGNVIRYLITKALRVDSKAWLEMSVGHTSISQIRIEADGSFKLISAGDVGHLPPSLLTGASGDGERELRPTALPH